MVMVYDICTSTPPVTPVLHITSSISQLFQPLLLKPVLTPSLQTGDHFKHTHTHTATMISMRPNTQFSFPSSAATHLATPIASVGLSIQARGEEKSLKLAFLSVEAGQLVMT